MAALLIGYARCSTDQQDLTAQRDGLLGLGVEGNRIYVDHGLTAPTETARASGKRRRPAARVTLWSSPSSTDSPGRCQMPGRSLMSSPRGGQTQLGRVRL